MFPYGDYGDYGVMVSTLDCESGGLSSILSGHPKGNCATLADVVIALE